jgi:plastocyanin
MADEEAPTSETPESSDPDTGTSATGTPATGTAAVGTAVATKADASVAVRAPAPGTEAHREAVRTRILIPLLLPLLTAGAVLVYVLNLSRALLAGGKWGSLTIASIVTVAILAGAALISSRPRMRTSSLVMLVSGLFVLIVAMGLTTVGPSDEKASGTGGGFQQPAGAAVATLKVTAEPELKFDSTSYTVKAGVVEIDYADAGGTHTLNFDSPDPKLAGFQLNVPGGPTKLKADLAPGKYTIYCSIPGHRAAGMQATVTVQ